MTGVMGTYEKAERMYMIYRMGNRKGSVRIANRVHGIKEWSDLLRFAQTCSDSVV